MLGRLAGALGSIPKEIKKPLDKGVVFGAILISCFGLIMIWSASMYEAGLDGNEYYYVFKQFIFLILGVFVMLFMSTINYSLIRYFADLSIIVTIALLIATMLFGESGNGAERWLRVGPVTIQASELAKISVLMFMSKEIEKRKNEMNTLQTFGLLLLFLAVVCGLIYKQPALSATVIVGGLAVIMYFMAGGNISYISILVGLGAVGVYILIVQAPWRMQRILAYLDPWSDITDTGWQPAQSLMALASGGLFGQGIGNGRAKLLFLPEAQNDYIFAIIGEELGIIGCIAVIAAYLYLIIKIINISLHAPDAFSRMFSAGFALLLSVQVFLNIAVVTNLVPSTGVMLPFISAGGSSLVTLMFALGIVLNISRHQKYSDPSKAVAANSDNGRK